MDVEHEAQCPIKCPIVDLLTFHLDPAPSLIPTQTPPHSGCPSLNSALFQLPVQTVGELGPAPLSAPDLPSGLGPVCHMRRNAAISACTSTARPPAGSEVNIPASVYLSRCQPQLTASPD
ncbi:hypothetical protein D4764_22G0005040 [Takifugu flavidus]|uniref:Uncharacterized protein n=1 Tax=Takifugu flavidus TaxID=433684 RepID=A0A5C6NH16_9TELE|nr:hypothetical protein D4764_22G0005040 [Takifugu flavidus]